MGALIRAIIAGALAGATVPVAGAPVDRWSHEIALASRRFGIPKDWVSHVMEAESGGRASVMGAPIVSAAGAMGLMQLMPETWLEMRDAYRLGPDPFDPSDNILAGTAYLRAMYDRFGYPGLFAAYNAGPGRYSRFLTGESLPPETVRYVRRVASPNALVARRVKPSAGRALALLRPTIFAVERNDAEMRTSILLVPAAVAVLAPAPVRPQ